jgi:DNA mismatch endonuclease (patch repair protein)
MKSSLPKIAPRSKRLPLTRSQMMGRIRSSDTRPEMLTRAAVHALGVRFRKHLTALPGKPDLANQKHKGAIFVHGCFWHSHRGCRLASQPKSNTAYWEPKLRRNKARDVEKVVALRGLGFKVLVVWECDIRGGSTLRAQLRKFFAGGGVTTAVVKTLVRCSAPDSSGGNILSLIVPWSWLWCRMEVWPVLWWV